MDISNGSPDKRLGGKDRLESACADRSVYKGQGVVMGKLTAQERVFEITRLLYENHVDGLSNKELAQRVGTSEVNICRDLAVFEQYKWIVRSESGRWRLSTQFGGISGQIIKSYQKAKLALVQEEAEYLSAIQ